MVKVTNASIWHWFLTSHHENNQFRSKLDQWKRKMGKLSKVLLKSLFFLSADAQTSPFAVTGCNAAVSNHEFFQIDADSNFLRIILQHWRFESHKLILKTFWLAKQMVSFLLTAFIQERFLRMNFNLVLIITLMVSFIISFCKACNVFSDLTLSYTLQTDATTQMQVNASTGIRLVHQE